MHILSFFAAFWMGLMSVFGVNPTTQRGETQAVVPPPQAAVSSTPTASSTMIIPAAPSSSAPTSTPPRKTPGTASSSVAAAHGSSVPASDLPSTGSAWLSTLPLGDGKYVTTGAKKGYVYVCHVATGGGGAQGTPTWISGSSWYPAQKVSVEGSVAWPSAAYSMAVNGSTRLITSNGLPADHPSGIFPIQTSDPAHQFDANPNSIKAQKYSFSLPASPTMLSAPQCIYGQVGIMNDGVPLFDGFDAEYRDAVAHETQDAWEAHPDESGEYHYHGFENAWVKGSVSAVVGFAFDGYPITGAKLADGTYLTSSQLDECHGVTSAVMLDGKTVTTYHYVLTQDFPYSVSCFRGRSYEPKPGAAPTGATQGTGVTSGGAPTPPAAAITACASGSSGSSCSFNGANGAISGTCQTPPGQTSLACVPAQPPQ